MKICIPVEISQGTEDSLHGHFYSAPRFIFYDTETEVSKSLENPYVKDDYKFHRSLKPLHDDSVKATIVGGVGRCALMKLNQSGVKVFRANGQSLEENINALAKGELTELKMGDLHWGHVC